MESHIIVTAERTVGLTNERALSENHSRNIMQEMQASMSDGSETETSISEVKCLYSSLYIN